MILSRLLLIPLFFPYVGSVQGLDLQPFFLLSMLYFISRHSIYLNRSHVVLALVALIAIFIVHTLTMSDQLIKLAQTVMFIVFMSILLSNRLFLGIITSQFVLIVMSTYIFVGLIQLVFPDFLTMLVSRDNEAIGLLQESGRGVRSLAAEPSQFARIVTSLSVLWFMLRHFEDKSIRNTKLILSVVLLLNLFLSRALYSVTIHFLIYIIYMFFSSGGLVKKNIYLFISIFVAVLFVNTILQESRLVILMFSIASDPTVIFNYGAVNRLFSPVVSVLAGLSGIFGYSMLQDEYITIFGHDFSLNDKLHGGYIGFIYNYGIAGLCYLSFLFLRFYKESKHLNNLRFPVISYFFLVPLIYSPLLNPMPFLILAVMLECRYKNMNAS